MPALSIVVVVTDPGTRLRECLNSVNTQVSSTDEILLVDTASSDRSRDALAAYAAENPRARAIETDGQVGYSQARNAGLAAVRTDYVLFLDGHDRLAPDALRAIRRRLDKSAADILLCGAAKLTRAGTVRPSKIAGPKKVFSAREAPAILDLPRPADDKIYRVEFLRSIGVRFLPGPFEEVSWTLPALLAADRIAILARDCFQHGPQSRRPTRKKKNPYRQAEVVQHYRAAFEFLERHPEFAEFSSLVAEELRDRARRLVRGGSGGIPRSQRPTFVADVNALLREHGEGPRGRSLGSYRAAAAVAPVVRNAGRARRRLGRTAARYRRPVGGAVRRARARYTTLVSSLPSRVYRVALRLPLDPKLAVYAAFWYRGYADNPRAVYEKMAELAPSITGVWLLRADAVDSAPEGTKTAVPGTAYYYWVLGRAKYLVNNANFPNEIVKRQGSVHVQTQHGTPLKYMGLQLKGQRAGKGTSFKKLMQRVGRWDFNVTSNSFSTAVWEKAFPGPYETLEVGYPRNDVLVRATPDDKQRLRAQLELPLTATVILYAPTFRDPKESFSASFDLEQFCRALPPDHVLLVRSHYFNAAPASLAALQDEGLLRDVSTYPDVQELSIASDVLITDYSSIQFDYANLRQPIVIYAHDWERYQRERGVNFDLLAEPPGAVATSEAALIDLFASGGYDTAQTRELLRRYRWRFCEFDNGDAAERVVRRVFLGEQVQPPPPLEERERRAAAS